MHEVPSRSATEIIVDGAHTAAETARLELRLAEALVWERLLSLRTLALCIAGAALLSLLSIAFLAFAGFAALAHALPDWLAALVLAAALALLAAACLIAPLRARAHRSASGHDETSDGLERQIDGKLALLRSQISALEDKIKSAVDVKGHVRKHPRLALFGAAGLMYLVARGNGRRIASPGDD